MHWSTYNRLRDQVDELDDRGWMSAVGWASAANPRKGPSSPVGA